MAPSAPTIEDIALGNVALPELRGILGYVEDEIPDLLTKHGITRTDFELALSKLDPGLLDNSVARCCRTDFLSFLVYEMGMETPPHIERWTEDLKSGEDCCFMAPRDHGKSLVMARAFPIWKAKYDPFIREIYILGTDQESAVENLDKIKELLVTRKSLRSLVPGNWKQGFNNRTSLRLTNGVVIRAKSIKSKLRGRHPQLIILDDVLNESNSDSELKRKQISDQFNSVVVPMRDKGSPSKRARGYRPQIVTIGTAMAGDDLYHEMLASSHYKGVRQSAILVDGKFEPILDAAGERQSLWPERYSVEELDLLRQKIGVLLFEREYMNKPLAEELAIFPRSLFEPHFDPALSYLPGWDGKSGGMTFMGVDLSVPGNQDGDFTVLYVVHYDPAEKRFRPMNYWRAQPSSVGEQLRQIELMTQLYRCTKVYIEANVFQKVYAQAFKQKAGHLPVEPFVTGKNKGSFVEGLLGMRPQFEIGSWAFPYATQRDRDMTDLFVREFGGFVQRKGKLDSESAHDDVPMAAWIGWHAAMDTSAGENWSVDWSW